MGSLLGFSTFLVSHKMQSVDTCKVKGSKNYTFLQEKIASVEERSPHLYIQHVIPKKKLQKKIKHIIFQHGAIEYHGRHIDLIEYIAEDLQNDFVISSLDLVGHGKSGGDRGHVSSFDVFTKDWIHRAYLSSQK